MNSTPQSEEAEKTVLQAMMLDPGAFQRHGIRTELFANAARQAILQAILVQNLNSRPVDPIALTDYLRNRNELDLVGGPSALADIYGYSASPVAECGYYVDILHAKLTQRQILIFARSTLEAATDCEDPAALLAEVQSQAITLGSGQEDSGSHTTAQMIERAIAEMQASADRGGGLSTGFEGIDRVTAGLFPGEQTVLAARPSVGKTALAMAIVANAAAAGRRVLFVSLEMPAWAIGQRLLAAQSGVRFGAIRTGRISQQRDVARIGQASGVLKPWDLTTVDRKPMSIEELTMRAIQHHRQKPIDLLVTDYVGLIRTHPRDDARTRVTRASEECKALADRLKCPHLLLAQLNRGAEGSEPRLSDLKESGGIEETADGVWLLHGERGESERTLKIAKARNGEVGATIPLEFHGDTMRWR